MQKNKYFHTENIYLAAYLLCKGIRLERIQKSRHDGVKLFVFMDSDKVKVERVRYVSRRAKVEPIEFRDRIRDLRSLVRGERMLQEALKEQ